MSIRSPRRVATRLTLLVLALACMLLAPTLAASAVKPRTSLPVIERQVMCVTCKIPLNVAESPQADRERAFIQELIDQGENEAQVKHSLVGQYGPAVLGLPADRGFDVTAYLVPLIVVAALLVMLARLLPRWRRRSRESAAERRDTPQPLAAPDAARLDADLARFD
jgi:cytochrome c-type biogenesis protein CcmH